MPEKGIFGQCIYDDCVDRSHENSQLAILLGCDERDSGNWTSEGLVEAAIQQNRPEQAVKQLKDELERIRREVIKDHYGYNKYREACGFSGFL